MAFLNAPIEEGVELYIEPPHTIKLNPGEQLRLRKGLYGLVQGSARWHILLAKTLITFGYTRNPAEPCLFSRTTADGTTFMAIVVDDFAITGSTRKAINTAKAELSATWDCTDFGELDWFVKINVSRHKSTGRMRLSQETYVNKMVDLFLPHSARPVSTPMAPDLKLSESMCPTTLEDKAAMKHVPYRELLGSLQYARLTRPDILQAISNVAKYQTNPGQAGLQPKTASSTSVAEYIALTSAVKELIWVRQMITSFGFEVENNIPVFEDNEACIHLATNPAAPKRTRHVDIRYHFIRDYCTNKTIDVQYVCTKLQVADILTKALPRPQFEHLRSELQVSKLDFIPDQLQ